MNLEEEIKSYLLYCKKHKNLSDHTVKAYKIDLFQFYSFKENMTISKNDLNEYIQSLHENFKPKTIHRKIASLKAFVKYLYFQDIIDSNPFDKISTAFKEPLILPRTIPAYLIQRLLSASYSNISAASGTSNKISLFVIQLYWNYYLRPEQGFRKSAR